MSDEITIEEFEARFDIERRTRQCCMEYLEEYAKIFPEHFKEFFEGTSTFTFKKRPSYWGGICVLWERATCRTGDFKG